MKKCTKCKKNKNKNKFTKRKSSKDGLDHWCLSCMRKSTKLSTLKNKEKNKKGIVISKKICPSCKIKKAVKFFGTNPGTKDGLRNECKNCRNIKMREKYKNDSNFRKKQSVRFAAMYLKNKEKILTRNKKWATKNSDKKLAIRHRRLARFHGQFEFDLPVDFIQILKKKQNNKCAYCLRKNIKLTVEHVLPLSRGAKHCIDNVILACTGCNYSKNAKTIEEWLEHNKKLNKYGIKLKILSTICKNLIKFIKNKNKTK